MIKTPKIIGLFMLLFWGIGFSQSKILSKKQIIHKIIEARNALSNLDCDRSLKLSQEALFASKSLNDNVLISKSYNVIGSNFYEFADINKSISYYNKALYYANLANNDTLKDWIYNNLGNVYTYRDVDFEKGMNYYKKGLFYTEKIKDPIQVTYNALNISGAYFDKGLYQKGYVYLKKAEKFLPLHQEVEARMTFYSQNGGYYSFLGQNVKAEENFKKAISYGKKDKNDYLNSYLAEVYADFSTHYFKNKKFELAYYYLGLSDKLKEDIYNSDRTQKVLNFENKIQIEEYKRQIDFIESEKQQQIKSLQKTQIIILLFAIIVFILLAFLYVLFKNYRFKKQNLEALQLVNHELQLAKEKAEESTRLKSQFVSTITHELRTPLYGVVGITDIITEEHPALKDSKYIKSLQFSAQYLLALVNDILQVYKISEKKIVLENFVFNLKEELESIKNSMHILAQKNKNEIILEIDPQIPEFLYNDKIRLSQIFINLMNNSLKFTEKGTVTVTAKVISNSQEEYEIAFSVRDTGIGIAKEDHEKIFDDFVQIGRSNEDYQGTGLGLPIVKKLIELFGGEVHLESEENKGTTVSFTLKLQTPPATVLSQIKPRVITKYPGKNFKVLLVEDNKINQIVTSRILKNYYFETTVVEDGLAAIEAVQQQEYDVVLMDINMPKINGFEASKQIRSLGIKTPIIALTAFDKQEIESQIIEAGIQDVIIKPFEADDFYQIILGVIQKASQ